MGHTSQYSGLTLCSSIITLGSVGEYLLFWSLMYISLAFDFILFPDRHTHMHIFNFKGSFSFSNECSSITGYFAHSFSLYFSPLCVCISWNSKNYSIWLKHCLLFRMSKWKIDIIPCSEHPRKKYSYLRAVTQQMTDCCFWDIFDIL